jgi:hypothetical protein
MSFRKLLYRLMNLLRVNSNKRHQTTRQPDLGYAVQKIGFE